ncbi:hypothetical protein [Eggerthella lenta]|uniref:hypothetical protein n=1 Tax=Eggerthella lenta TaxID=84112 RepID=UPI0011868923|nr:hypothetical protein [Eggerthella lenta]MCG4515551.1 hypothetical protein [Eggerthella lenta]MDY3948957.1 hypothetical protein [Eggerthella lenta]
MEIEAEILPGRLDKESFYWKAGYEHFGPLLVGFSDWIAGEARREELDQILFLARDGYVPIQAFRLLYPSQNAKTTYFFASRASTLATRVLEEGSLESFLRNAHLRRLSSPALLAQRFDLGSRFLELAAKEAKIEPASSVDRGLYFGNGSHAFFARMAYEEYLPRAKKFAGMFARYVSEQVSSGNIGVVDVGWHGSTQRALMACADDMCASRRYLGYYFGVSDVGRSFAKGFLYDGRGNKEDYFDMKASSALLELFLGAPHATTGGYKLNGAQNRVIPVFGAYEYASSRGQFEREHDALWNLREGALSYVKEEALNARRVPLGKEQAFRPLKSLATNPSNAQLRAFGSLRFLEGGMHSVAEPSGIKSIFRNPKQIIEEFGESTWKYGFLCRFFHCKAVARVLYGALLKAEQ